MGVDEFNTNTPRHLARIAATGEPIRVTYHHKPRVTVTPSGMFEELLDAAGERGKEILSRYRADAEQQKQETAA